jgi:hypothetical protein
MPPTSQQRGSSSFTHADGVTLKEYVDLRFEQDHTALVLAEKTLGIHLAQLNEFKEALQDQTTTYATRNEMDLKFDRWISEYRTAHEAVCRDIDELKEFRTIIETKASVSSVTWAYIISGISILFTLWELIRSLA